MEAVFTKHAKEKFDILQEHGVSISRTQVEEVLKSPDHIDRFRYPLLIAQGAWKSKRILRVIHRKENSLIIVITFYPARISHHDKI